MEYLVPYKSSPAAEDFREYSLDELRDEEFAANFRDPELGEAKDWTEWGRSSFALDQEGYSKALDAAKAGKTVLVAVDEDGYYFAARAAIAKAEGYHE